MTEQTKTKAQSRRSRTRKTAETAPAAPVAPEVVEVGEATPAAEVPVEVTSEVDVEQVQAEVDQAQTALDEATAEVDEVEIDFGAAEDNPVAQESYEEFKQRSRAAVRAEEAQTVFVQQELIEHVRTIAKRDYSYDGGGWDVIADSWTDEQIAAAIVGASSPLGAQRKMSPFVERFRAEKKEAKREQARRYREQNPTEVQDTIERIAAEHAVARAHAEEHPEDFVDADERDEQPEA